jgi:hypothetical protein
MRHNIFLFQKPSTRKELDVTNEIDASTLRVGQQVFLQGYMYTVTRKATTDGGQAETYLQRTPASTTSTTATLLAPRIINQVMQTNTQNIFLNEQTS